MKDRKVGNLPQGAMAPLVAVLLLGAFWLGAWVLSDRDATPQEAVAESSSTSPPAVSATSREPSIPHQKVAENHGDWLPPLSDQTRQVLNVIPLPQDPGATSLQPAAQFANATAVKPNTAAVTDGPMLALPKTVPAAGNPMAAGNPTAAGSPIAAGSSMAAGSPVAAGNAVGRGNPVATGSQASPDRGPRPPEIVSRPMPPRRLPPVAPDAAEPLRTDKPAEPQRLPPVAQDDAEPRPLAIASAGGERPAPRPVKAVRPLPPMKTPASRSEQLELIAREADAHSRSAFQLAGRGAVYAARAELIAAVRLVAQGLDGEEQTTAHSRALAAALTALKEVEDFAPGRAWLEAEPDLGAIIAVHRTSVLHDAPGDGLTALNAMRSYLTFAQQQLAAACGHEVAASMALYGLGKVHTVLASRQSETIRAAAPKAVAFYQAAILVNPRNYMASNDLGVLLAQAGRYQEARAALEHSTVICRQAENWQNLAKVYRHAGQLQRAQYAEQQVAAIRQEMSRRSPGTATASGLIQWVDADVLAQSKATPGASPLAPGSPANVGNGSGQGQAKNLSQARQGQSGRAGGVETAKGAVSGSKSMSARLPNALFENRK